MQYNIILYRFRCAAGAGFTALEIVLEQIVYTIVLFISFNACKRRVDMTISFTLYILLVKTAAILRFTAWSGLKVRNVITKYPMFILVIFSELALNT